MEKQHQLTRAYAPGDVIRGLIVIVVVTAIAALLHGCVSARYTTSHSTALAGECGAFRAESYTRGVAVSEAAQNYGTACQAIEMAHADAAYVRSLQATAAWYAATGGEVVDEEARRNIDFLAGKLADNIEDVAQMVESRATETESAEEGDAATGEDEAREGGEE